MNTEIKYNGYSANPSDYESTDGELAISLGMVPEDGALHNIPHPKVEYDFSTRFPYSDIDILLVHRPQGKRNLVFMSTSRQIEPSDKIRKRIWYWDNSKTEAPTDEGSVAEYPLYILGEDEIFKSIEAIGNTLIIITSKGMFYCLYKDDICKLLGTMPDIPEISFGLDLKKASGTTFDYHFYNYDVTWTEDKAELDKRRESEFTFLMGEINKNIAQFSKEHFCFPFYVRYAFRLYDGTLTKHSAPILMIPCVRNPILTCTTEDESGKGYSRKLYRTIPRVSYADLVVAKVYEYNKEEIQKWSDIIKSIDIFITTPIYTYNQGMNSKDYFAGVLSVYDIFSPLFGRTATGATYEKHSLREFWSSELTNPETGELYMILNNPMKQDYFQKIGECSSFYKYSSIPLNDFTELLDGDKPKTDVEDLTIINTREVMTDDFSSHNNITGKTSYAYNGRIDLGGITKELFKGFKLTSCQQFTSLEPNMNNEYKVWVRKEGKVYVVGYDKLAVQKDIRGVLVYFFYPDPDAFRLQITVNMTVNVDVEMKPHPFLHGAYFYNDLNYISMPSSPTTDEFSKDRKYSISNELYVSEINNPFVFPSKYIVSIGNGEILGLSSATQALSQGQFGQFPLYAFTTDGVWALSVSDTGVYSAVQPITRDICSDAESITQLDGSVVFSSGRGIMMLSGSESICISDILRGDVFFPRFYKQLYKLAEIAGYRDFNQVDLSSFDIFADGARFIYDYKHQRLIMYNPESPENIAYSYVFSLKDKKWGMMGNNIKSNPKTYPSAIAMTEKNKLVNFSKVEDGKDLPRVFKGFIMTRPLKLDSPDILKTVDAIIQRGRFARGHINTALYGSRDLEHWFIVGSSVDHRLVGIHGTPYKYFRIAIVSTMDENESLYGASIEWKPKETNKMR